MRQIKIKDLIGENGLLSDGDWVESKDQDATGTIRLIQLADIGDGIFKNKSRKFMNENKFMKLNCTELKEGDILIARMPDPLGRACIFPKLGNKSATVVDVTVLRVDDNIADNRFVMYMINTPNFRNTINSNVTGTTRKRISKKNLSNLQIPLPSLLVQKEIVKELDRVNLLIQKRKESINLLDEYLKSVFLDMFGDPVLNHKKWPTKTIEEIVKNEKYSIKRGPFGGSLKKEMFVDNGYLVYEQYHALNRDFSFERYYIDEKKFQELKAFEVKAGDIIISCSGVYLGKLAEIPRNYKKGIINQALLKISLDNSVMRNQIFMDIFTNPSFKAKYLDKKIGSGIPNFPPISVFKTFKFICPDLQSQINYEEKVEKVGNLRKKMRGELNKLEELSRASITNILTN